MPKPSARLIVASSETSPDLLYATGFQVPDPVIWLSQKGRTTMVLSSLEIDRGRREARVDEIISLTELNQKIAPQGPEPRLFETVLGFLRSRRVRSVSVPSDFPFGLANFLQARGITLVPEDGLFFASREFKTADEIKKITRAIRITEAGLARAVEVLKASDTGRGGILQWGGQRLTSELLRAEIESAILRHGGIPAHTIVAGGNQACDPHERGSGPLRANSLIILDIFPRDARSGYFGDITRTVVRGQASEAQRRLWDTALEGQQLALKRMKPGVDGAVIDQEIRNLFTARGYPTEVRGGRQAGFFHGTGHGLGLEIHEIPRMAKTRFRPGQVITVEPGLYYHGLGGVRHEDDVVITEKGIRILSSFPKQLEI